MLQVLIYIADAILLVILSVLFVRLKKAQRIYKAPTYTTEIAQEADLPSVSVCIPARNEQHALTDCLQRVLDSTYQKLEIIVLDDVSGDNTSALIKSFASEGVRFVKGSPLKEGWIGKNHAYQELLEEASGTYVLFVDVDTVLAPNAIENIVRYAISQRLTMLSVLPRRNDGWRASVIFSPLRFFWEILFASAKRPASASNAWLVRRDSLQKELGGFESIKNTVRPAEVFAAALAKSERYKFIMSSESFGVGFEKKWRSQLITSVRLLYPLLGKNLLVAIFALFDLCLLLVPFVVLIYESIVGDFSLALLIVTTVTAIGYSLLYASYAHAVWKKGWLAAFILWPLIVVQELLLVLSSVWQYSRGTLKWKGRSIQPEVRN